MDRLRLTGYILLALSVFGFAVIISGGPAAVGSVMPRIDPITIGTSAMVLMLVLLVLGVPIVFALGVAALLGFIIHPSLTVEAAAHLFSGIVVEHGRAFSIVALPLFILMGQLVFHANIARDMFDCFYKWFGRLPGGLGVTAVVCCAGFGAVTGSTLAAVATMGTMLMPILKEFHYSKQIGSGAIASGGTLAILIPPSIPLVFYALWAEQSVGALFLAGIVPGILLTAVFAIYIVVICGIKPSLGRPGPKFPWWERVRSLVKLLPIFLIFGIVLGGIYMGVMTADEASAIGVIGVLIISIAMGRMTWPKFLQSLKETGVVAGMIFLIFVGGKLFQLFLTQTGVIGIVTSSITSLEISPYWIMVVIIFLLLILGMIVDTFGMQLLTLPFLLPIVSALGYDLVWFGIFFVIMTEIALITPPVGINVFILKRIAPDVPTSQMFKGVIPFALLALAVVFLLLSFPEIALWLPTSMR
jgi:tripartite ATP-independent transporter DctM subunit